MAVPLDKTSFISGEISPGLFGHVDFTKFVTGASTMRNMFVSYRGGAVSRPGTSFVGYSKQIGRNYPPRLITFQFSIQQGLVLEFGNLYMRVIKDGAFVLENYAPITAITNVNPGSFSVVNTWSTGDWIYLKDIAGIPSISDDIYVITSRTATTMMLQDVFGNVLDTTLLGTYTGGGSAARVYTLVTPYGEADLEYLKFTESADVMSFCCWNQVTNTSYPAYDLTRLNDANWSLTEITLSATILPPTSCSGTTTSSGSTDYNYRVTAISSSDGTESIGSPIADIPSAVNIAATAGTNTITWPEVSGAKYYNVYKTLPGDEGVAVPPGSSFGYCGQAVGVQFNDTNITADFSQVPPTHQDPFSPGQITDVAITGNGSGLTTVTWVITTAAGTGFDGFPVIVGSALASFVVTNTGKNYAPGDSIAFNSAGYAAGAITFAVNPSPADTITLNGVVWTFVLVITGTAQTLIQGTLALTLTQLNADLSASTNPLLTVASYRVTGAALVINYLSAGTGGNAYTLAAPAATPSGAHLTGGSGTAGTAPTATLVVGPTTGTYPSLPAYYQQRRVYASSPNNPDTYRFSQPGAFLNFDTRIPTISSDAITGTPWSVQVNGLQFMVAMPGGLVVLTGLSAWQLTGTGGSSLNPQPITPSSQQAQPQAYNGCSATVPPIKIDLNILYVQAKGSIVRNLKYQIYANIYSGVDMTQPSSHLFGGFLIKEWAWAEEPNKVLVMIRDDGIMLSLTYLEAEQVTGWARHDTQGLFKSICSVTEPPIDAIYTCVQRFTSRNTPTYFIERFNEPVANGSESAWYVDAGVSLPQSTPNATLTASSATGLGSITGVMNLVGGVGYSTSTYAVVVDNNGQGAGTGAVPVLTIVLGVITAITFAGGSQGSGYIYPSIQIIDPTGSGSGASATAILNNSMTFTASAPVFLSGMETAPKYIIRMGGGKAQITGFTSTTQVTANMLSPITSTIPNTNIPAPATSGNWTLTKPVTTIYGLNHLIGMTVTGLADGQVIPPTVVSALGTITLATAASSIIVGLSYTAQLQTPYIDAGNPTIQGQRKKIEAATIRMQNSCAAQVGCNQVDGSTLSPIQVAVSWVNMDTMPVLGTSAYNDSALPLYTGDVRMPISGGYSRPGQIAVQQTLPLPLNILSVIPEVSTGDTPQPPHSTQPPQQGR